MPNSSAKPNRKPRALAHVLVESLTDRIRSGQIAAEQQLPTEAAIMAEFEVSRTVVREALSRLQASGLVETRHGIGSFVIGSCEAVPFRISPSQMATLRDVIAVLELRIGVETEATSLAARRRSEENLAKMRMALDAFNADLASGNDAVAPDFQFHLEIAKASQNTHYSDLMTTLGVAVIPRARLGGALDNGNRLVDSGERRDYLRRVNDEHEGIFDAIVRQDCDAARAAMRTHLVNSHERNRHAASL